MPKDRQPNDLVTMQVPAHAHHLLKSLSSRGYVSVKLLTLATALAFEELEPEAQVRWLNTARTQLLHADRE